MFDRGENNPKKSSPSRGGVFTTHPEDRFRTELPQLSYEIRAPIPKISKNFPENLPSIESRVVYVAKQVNDCYFLPAD